MGALNTIYGTSLALLTDLYQLTMAYGYWKVGRAEDCATFNLFFRRSPFGGAYTLAAGLEYVVDYLESLRFDEDDTAYLSTLRGNDDAPLFSDAFLEYLREMRWQLDIDAMPEGTVAFPHEPLIRVTGPLPQCQIIETPLLTMVNFQTLVATKASRVVRAARGEPVLEFGLRRAQGIDGGVSVARASYIGGVAATSNVLAGRLFGIPVKGTHAHSWVMSFDDEVEAFERYAEAMPNNCVFLVDTYDTVAGVHNAARVASQLRDRGHRIVGIRLDSGDLAELSIEARRILDEAGFHDAAIVGSSDLDEYRVVEHKQRGGRINVWGVGTRLATAYDQPALGGVYKISAIKAADEDAWRDTLKLSDDAIKVSNPGRQQVRRFTQNRRFVADVIFDERLGVSDPPRVLDIATGDTLTDLPDRAGCSDLLVPVFRNGERVYDLPSLAEVQERAASQLDRLDDEVLKLEGATAYPVGLDARLFDRKTELMREARTASEAT